MRILAYLVRIAVLRIQPFPVLAVFLLLGGRSLRADEPVEIPPTVLLEKLKAFIQDPPEIQDLVFSHTWPPAVQYDAGGKTVGRTEAPPEFLRARWSPAAFVLVQVPSLKDINLPPLASNFELKQGSMLIVDLDGVSSIFSGNRSITRWWGKVPERIDLENPVLAALHVGTLHFFTLMNMGAHFIPPRSIHWTGNQFTYTAHQPRDKFHISGALALEGNPPLPVLRLVYRANTAFGKHIIHYDYTGNRSNNVPPFLPTRISARVETPQEELRSHVFEILSLTLDERPNKANVLDSESWVKRQSLSEFVFTNSALFAVDPGGKMRMIPRQLNPSTSPIVLAHTHRYYYVACGALSLGFVILRKRMALQTNKTSTN